MSKPGTLDDLSLEQKKALLKQLVQERQLAQRRAAAPILPIPRNQPLPASFSQERLWVFEQMFPGNPAYNCSFLVRMRGSLHSAALQRSLDELLRRHEGLRTTLQTADGKPVQVIAPSGPVALPLVDLGHLPAAARAEALGNHFHRERDRAYHLSQGPLVRFSLVRLADDEHALVVAYHHLVADGLSVVILLRELGELYTAYQQGLPSPLPELPIQFADFAWWQREWLEQGALDTQLAYWRQALEGAPSVLQLPADAPRSPTRTYQGDSVPVRLEPELVRRLELVGRQSGATLFMSLLALWDVLLARYSGQEDFLVGVVSGVRDRAGTERLIGNFNNTLIVRAQVNRDLTFRQVLEQVRERSLLAYSNKDVPFERLIAELQPDRDLSHSVMVQAILDLQNEEMTPPRMAGLETTFEYTQWRMDVDLSLFLFPRGGGLEGMLAFQQDIFRPETAARMAAHLGTLAEAVTARPDERIGALPLLTAAERRRQLVEWNQTERALPEGPCTVHQLFEQRAQQIPDEVALSDGDRELTYRELDQRSLALARRLVAEGVRPGQLVGILVERSCEMVVGLLGILRAGAAYVPMDPAYPWERLSYMIADSGAQVVVTQRHLEGRLAEAGVRAVCVESVAAEAAASLEPAPVEAPGEGLAYVMYTSGSTGRPKGVMVTHRNVVNFIHAMDERLPVKPPLVWGAVTSISFDISVLELFWTLSRGFKVVLLEGPLGGPQPERITQAMVRRQVRYLQCTPSLAGLLVREPEARVALGALELLLVGGEALPPGLVAELAPVLGGRLFNMYGPTETTIWSSVAEVTPSDRRITVGRPILNTELFILDADLQPTPVGVVGELYIGGEGVARGYWNRPELTAERFITNPVAEGSSARLYRTGDLAQWLPTGEVELLGRADHQVKLRGHRIELGEIEAALGEHPGVKEAVVAAREDPTGDRRLVAWYVPRTGSLAAAELRSRLQARLPEYMIPALFVELEALPLTPNGKVDRAALQIPAAAAQRAEAAGAPDENAPRTEVERSLTEIWSGLLGGVSIGVHDNFFELGGHSVLAVRLGFRIREELGVDVPAMKVFESPTVASMAEVVQQLQAAAAATRAAEVAGLSDAEVERMLRDMESR